MKLKDADDAHKDFTKLASDLARQLALAGLAIVWIFKVDGPDGAIRIPTSLLIAGLFLSLCLLADYVQYAYAGTAWGIYHRRKELELQHDQTKDFKAPESLNYVTNGAWYTKMVAVFLAYGVILFFFIGALVQRAKGPEPKAPNQTPPAAASTPSGVKYDEKKVDPPKLEPPSPEPKAEPKQPEPQKVEPQPPAASDTKQTPTVEPPNPTTPAGVTS
jgi:hypothetical protein